MTRVLLIMGSVRAGRICPKIAQWVAELGRALNGFDYEIVDLADWPLPLDDEPYIPAMSRYAQPHTLAWSEKISHSDAVVFVTPQYNWGYPAALKNAIDHLYTEWCGKPAAIITYGGHGGGRCARQLKQVAASVKMRLAPRLPGIVLSDAIIREGADFDPAHDFARHAPAIRTALRQLAKLTA